MQARNMVVAGLVAILLALGSVAMANVNMQTVPVGNVGNTGEWSGVNHGGYGPDRICGAVNYGYNIGKHEVTAGQYREFLSAVAGVDTYGLYNPGMWVGDYGCKIERFDGDGTVGNPYKYHVDSDWANRPVNYVSFWDACRFANWLHNGQGNGDTETGAYTLTADGIADNTVTRNTGWKWAVTSEDEWYKAAYHKNDGVTGNYYDYPTSNDTSPSNDLINPDPGNNATFYDDGYTIGRPYSRTNVGDHENSRSPYGTFDQGGNVCEWNETIISTQTQEYRVLRGGSFGGDEDCLQALSRVNFSPAWESYGYELGFRVSEVPEPTTMVILALGGIGMLVRRRDLRR